MIFHYILIIATLLLSVGSKSPSLAQKILSKPQEYTSPFGPIGVVLRENLNPTPTGGGNDWIVYSDRDNNFTYTAPDGVHSSKKMMFMEAFYVVDETEKYVHIFKYDNSTIKNHRNRALSASAIDYGWAHKDKMLLWGNSLIDPKTKFSIKALMVNKPESLKNPGKYVKEKNLRLFNSPTLEISFENDNDVKLFHFLFVYKKDYDDNRVLIGRTNSLMTPNSADKYILGWLSEDVVQIWDHRVVLEPNWSGEASEERAAQNIRASVMATENSARAFCNSKAVGKDQILWSKDTFNIRRKPSWIRFPILESLPGDIVKTGVVSDIFDKNGQVVIKTEEYLELEELYHQIRHKYRNVNVVFVVDGTGSMGNYFKPITNSLRSALNLKADSPNDYKFGAVIYRDYPEENCRERNRLIDSKNLTSNPHEVISFLETMIPEARDCMDRDTPEAMYHGIEKALRMMKEDETNIIILVGDAGNHQDDPRHTPSQIIDLLTEKECSLMAYQVRHGNSPAYNDFIAQTSKLIAESCTNINKKSNPGNNQELLKPIFQQIKSNVYRMNFPEGSPIPGTIVFSKPGVEMSVTFLEEELDFLLRELEDQHEKMLADLDSQLKSVGERSSMNAAVYRLLKKIVQDEDLLKRTSLDNYQFFAEGYTSIRVMNLKHPLYQYVLFVDNQELEMLRIKLQNLWGAGTISQRREHLVEVYKQTLINHYGKDGKDMLNKKSPAEVMALITGLPSQSELMNKYTVADLEDRKRVSEVEIEKIIKLLENKYRDLSQIAGNPDFIFWNFDTAYYWIPQYMMP